MAAHGPLRYGVGMGIEGGCDATDQVVFVPLFAQVPVHTVRGCVAHGDLLRYHTQGRLRPGLLRSAIKDAMRNDQFEHLACPSLDTSSNELGVPGCCWCGLGDGVPSGALPAQQSDGPLQA